MNTERIGEAAGTLWRKLHVRGPMGILLADLKKLPGFTPDEATAALGWLAREGKLAFQNDGKKLAVSLVEDEILVGT